LLGSHWPARSSPDILQPPQPEFERLQLVQRSSARSGIPPQRLLRYWEWSGELRSGCSGSRNGRENSATAAAGLRTVANCSTAPRRYSRRSKIGLQPLQRLPDGPQYPCNACVPSSDGRKDPICISAPFGNRPEEICNACKHLPVRRLRLL
jgi:hypothetical protein